MKKTDVYVVVDTPKKAKKLKKLLDMFGEKHFADCHDFVFEDCVGEVVHFWEGAYFTYCSESNIISKSKVSIKELRNILAKEHLKSGDVVALGYGKSVEYIGVFKAFNNGYFEVDRYLSLNSGSGIIISDSGYIKNFIRYATEEEKALLEPKKELEVGKWYKGNVDIESLIFITEIENVKYYNRIHGYGFIGGKWANSGHLFSNTDHEKSLVEASFEDVKQELIKEANRLGHNYERYSYDTDENNLCGYNGRLEEIFVDGVWNKPQDKLSNLKEAYNNGYCVEFYDEKTDTWKRHENPCWNPELKWRIMVNNGHFVVSDVYILNQIKELKKYIEEIKSNIK